MWIRAVEKQEQSTVTVVKPSIELDGQAVSFMSIDVVVVYGNTLAGYKLVCEHGNPIGEDKLE